MFVILDKDWIMHVISLKQLHLMGHVHRGFHQVAEIAPSALALYNECRCIEGSRTLSSIPRLHQLVEGWGSRILMQIPLVASKPSNPRSSQSVPSVLASS